MWLFAGFFISHLYVMANILSQSKCSLGRVISWLSIVTGLRCLFLEREKMYVAHVIMSNIKLGIILVIDYLLSAYHVENTELKWLVFWSLFFLFTVFYFHGWWSWLNQSLSHADILLVWSGCTFFYFFFYISNNGYVMSFALSEYFWVLMICKRLEF